MVEQLLQEAEQETWPALEERKYLRVVGGKVIYISKAEAMEEVLLGPLKKLSGEDILITEWNRKVEWANRLKERISLVHQMMRDDNQRPSQCEPAYNTLWNQYRDAIESLREFDSDTVDRFRDKVVARVKELEVRINGLCDDWDPDYFDYFERTLVCYEKAYDLMVDLDGDLPLPNTSQEVAHCTRELLATRGWCRWKCSVLNGDVIVVIRNEMVTGYPGGYAVYTEAELEQLCHDDVSEATLHSVHKAKKLPETTMATNAKQLTLPEAAMVWVNDLLWSWINTELAKKDAKRLGKDPIHYACTVVPIPPGDPRRSLPPEDVLRALGHEDIIVKLRMRSVVERQDPKFVPLVDRPLVEYRSEARKLKSITSLPWKDYLEAIKARKGVK